MGGNRGQVHFSTVSQVTKQVHCQTNRPNTPVIQPFTPHIDIHHKSNAEKDTKGYTYGGKGHTLRFLCKVDKLSKRLGTFQMAIYYSHRGNVLKILLLPISFVKCNTLRRSYGRVRACYYR